MLNKFILFCILYVMWILFSYIYNILTLPIIVIGLFISIFITMICFAKLIVTKHSTFLFLKFGFYIYVFEKIFTHFSKVLEICLNFVLPNVKYTSLIDYILLNKDSDSEAVFTANFMTLLPGTVGILMKKRYFIVQSLDISYFSLSEMYNISVQIAKLNNTYSN